MATTTNRPKIKITIAKHSGFCFGVKRAFNLACAASRGRGKVYILGKLVHNNDVCRDLREKGVREIKSLSEAKEGAIIFTAHGVGPGLYEKAAKKGLKIIDTTCPNVVKVQRLAQNFAKKGYQIVILGDRGHKEVKGIFEWLRRKARIVGNFEELKKIKIAKKKKYCLVSQTTQNVAELEKIRDYLTRELGANVKRMRANNFACFNTICDSTNNRQNEVRKLAKANDAVVVIGGRDSANSKRLYEIAKKINKKSYFIENASQLKKNWFDGIKKIAISAGASTPESAIKKVVCKIKK